MWLHRVNRLAQSTKAIRKLLRLYLPRYNLNYSKFQAPPSMMKGITEIWTQHQVNAKGRLKLVILSHYSFSSTPLMLKAVKILDISKSFTNLVPEYWKTFIFYCAVSSGFKFWRVKPSSLEGCCYEPYSSVMFPGLRGLAILLHFRKRVLFMPKKKTQNKTNKNKENNTKGRRWW